MTRRSQLTSPEFGGSWFSASSVSRWRWKSTCGQISERGVVSACPLAPKLLKNAEKQNFPRGAPPPAPPGFFSPPPLFLLSFFSHGGGKVWGKRPFFEKRGKLWDFSKNDHFSPPNPPICWYRSYDLLHPSPCRTGGFRSTSHFDPHHIRTRMTFGSA